MKRKIILFFAVIFILMLTSCNNRITQTDFSYVPFRSYVYEKGSFSGMQGDDFTITIYYDGTWTYTEGMASSHFAAPEKCSWELNNGILILTEKRFNDMEYKNYFSVEDDCLIYQSEGSDNFIYTKVKNGEKFVLFPEKEETNNKTKLPENFVASVTGHYLSDLGENRRSEFRDISAEDTTLLLSIFNGNEWAEDTSECIRDCVIVLKGNLFYYHSSCGTVKKVDLSTVSTQSSKEISSSTMLILNETAKQSVNDILGKYIDLER